MTEEPLALRAGELLRVPLDAELPANGFCIGLRDGLDRLDHAVGAARDDAMETAHPPDGLVVEAVDAAEGEAEGRRQSAIRLDAEVVAIVGVRVPMLLGIGLFTGQVGVELAAAEPSEELHAVADSEDREAAGARCLDQCLVEGELGLGDRIELDLRRQGLVGKQVIAARHEQAIEDLDQGRHVALDRELERNPARPRDRIGVASIDVVVVAAGAPAAAVVEAERDSDSGAAHGRSIAI